MSSSTKKWLIKSKDGKVLGPLTTKNVVEGLQLGSITEEDLISIYPSHQWFPITHNAEFYDILLNLLADRDPHYKEPEDTSGNSDRRTSQNSQSGESSKNIYNDESDLDDETPPPIQTPPSPFGREVKTEKSQSQNSKSQKSQPWSQTQTPSEAPKKREVNKNQIPEEPFKDSRKGIAQEDEEENEDNLPEDQWKAHDFDLKSPPLKKVKKSEAQLTIELDTSEKAEKKAKFKSLIFAFAVLFVASVLLFIFILPSGEGSGGKVRLIAPQKKVTMTREELVESFRVGSDFFFKSTVKNYVKAQSKFTQVLEGYPGHIPAMSLLCMTYLELWPYAHKDASDLKALTTVMQMAAKEDPTGVKGNPCNVVHLIVKGESLEAEGYIDGVLSGITDEEAPPTFYYYLKALSLEKKGSNSAALGYLSSVQEIVPNWLEAYVFEGKIQSNLKDYAAAARRYKQILDAFPEHKESMILWGLLEHQQFFRRAEAKSLLKRAVDINEIVSSKLLSDAFTALAEIAVYENDKSLALEYAKKAYNAYSSNKVAEALVRKFGGSLTGTENIKGGQLVDEGEIFENQGDCNSAQALYKTAFEKNPKNGLAALKAAKCLWKLSLSTEAIEWLNKSIKADPNLIDSYVTLSDYYSQRYDFEAASAILVKANAISPKNYEVFRSYAQIELRRLNYKGAITYAKQALQLFESDVDTHILLIKAYLKTGQINEAYNLANRAIELNPNSREANIEYAKTLAAARGVVAGEEYMNNLINRFPLILEYRLALGRIYFQDERYNDARVVFEQILNIDAQYKDAKVELGRTYRFLSALEMALDQFLQAAVMDPADAVPLFEAGLLYMQIQKPEKAMLQFERVLRINKIYPLAHYYMGRAALQLNDVQKAIEFSQSERKINNKLPEPYILAAEAYMQMGQYSLCAQEYHKAINLAPQGALIYLKIATCHRLSGNLDIAESMLKQAEVIENGLPDIYREQGQIYEQRGVLDRAILAYDKYLALSPNAPDAQQVRQKINSLLGN